MDECLNKNNVGKKTLPVAYLVCNQTPPSKDKPSLMSFEEVQTLFHEFGHGLQHMLTTVNLPQAAGINNVDGMQSNFQVNLWKTGVSIKIHS